MMPTKVMYLEFEEDGELEFEFYLTLKLGLGTVQNLRATMGESEFMMWGMYFQREAQRKELASLKTGG